MKRSGEAVISLPVYQVVGYWGYGKQRELEHLLAQIVHQPGTGGSPAPPVLTRTSSTDTTDCIWGIAYLGLTQLTGAIAPTPPAAIATLTASGLLTDEHSPGEFFPDAWVQVQDRCLTLGREPFGRVPLYWLQSGSVLWFASRLSLLLPVVSAPQICLPALYGYSCFSYIPTPLSPVIGISVIPAGVEQTWSATGETVALDGQRRSLEWQEPTSQRHDEATVIAQLQTLLKDAVARQIADLDDAPVGIFLSGGLDSSIIAALLVQLGINVHAYTLDFGEASIAEIPYAESVAAHLNIPLRKIDVTPRQIRRVLPAAVQALDVPFGDGVTVPLFLLNQVARQDVQVVFNGEGGDQLFAGWTNKPLIAAGVYQTEYPAESDFAEQYLRTFHRLWTYESQIFQAPIAHGVESLDIQTWLKEALDPAFSQTLLHRLRRATLMLKGAQNIHPRATNLAVANGLKVRSPFCDRALAQFAFQIAGELHLQGSCEKYILKQAVAAWLPPDVVWRPKRGMGVPLTSWCFNGLWHDLGIWLNPGRLQQEGIWQPQIATRIAAGELGTIQGRRIGESLWLLLMWQVWQDTVLKQSRQRYSFDHPFWLPAWLGQQYLRYRRQFNQ